MVVFMQFEKPWRRKDDSSAMMDSSIMKNPDTLNRGVDTSV